jgi:glutathione-specific gamma-glutamylcyclotransferase
VSDLWIFGYGSLMWRPGFAYREARLATLHGHMRSFCIYSVYHRGTKERPGLVLGLDRGGACRGMAYRIGPDEAAGTLAYLREREQVTGAYRETRAPIGLDHAATHEPIEAVTFVAERAHPQYAGALPMSEQAHIIRSARGRSGSNITYLVSTVDHLAELGIRDRPLERLTTLIGGLSQLRHRTGGHGDGRRHNPTLIGRAHAAAPVSRMAQAQFNFRRNIANGALWHG